MAVCEQTGTHRYAAHVQKKKKKNPSRERCTHADGPPRIAIHRNRACAQACACARVCVCACVCVRARRRRPLGARPTTPRRHHGTTAPRMTDDSPGAEPRPGTCSHRHRCRTQTCCNSGLGTAGRGPSGTAPRRTTHPEAAPRTPAPAALERGRTPACCKLWLRSDARCSP